MAGRPGPVRGHEDGQELVLRGVGPEPEKTEGQGGKAVVVPDVAREAVPVGCEVQGAPGHEAAAVRETGRRQEPVAGSAPRSRAAKAAVGKGVGVDAEPAPAGCGSGLQMDQGPEAGRVAELRMVKPEAGPMEHRPVWELGPGAGLPPEEWRGQPGQGRREPAPLAAGQRSLSHSRCPEGWGCWGRYCDCLGQCPWGHCSLHH